MQMIDRRAVVFGVAAATAVAGASEAAPIDGHVYPLKVENEATGERFWIEAVEGRLISSGSMAPAEAARFVYDSSTLPALSSDERRAFDAPLAIGVNEGTYEVRMVDGQPSCSGTLSADDDVRQFCEEFARLCSQ